MAWPPTTHQDVQDAVSGLQGSRLGATVAAWGDSIPGASGEPFLAYAGALSGGFRITDIVSHGGYTSTQLVPLVTDITLSVDKPSTCIIVCGSNDAQQQVALATYSANVTAIVTAMRAASVTPVLCTIPPLTNTTYRPFQQQYNVWLQRYAASERLNLIPFAGVLSGTDGDWNPTYSSGDGIHPNAAGTKAMGQAIASALAFPATDGLLPGFSGGINLAPNGLFTADNGSGVPTSYNWPGTVGSSTALSTVTGVAGKVWTVTLASAAAAVNINGGEVTTGFAVGDRLRVAARAGAGQDGGTPNLQLSLYAPGYATQTGNLPLFTRLGTGAFSRSLTGGIMQAEFNVPANTGVLLFQWSLGTTNGTYTLAQLGLWNLTALGIA